MYPHCSIVGHAAINAATQTAHWRALYYLASLHFLIEVIPLATIRGPLR